MLVNANKSITPENYETVRKRMWDIRTLPEKNIPIKGLVVMYNKKISFLFPKISLTITIRHAALYGMIDTLFETIFNFAEKVEQPWVKK